MDRIAAARQEILDQSRDNGQDWMLQQSSKILQETENLDVVHRPECQMRQKTENPMVPKASVAVVTVQETVSVSLPDGSTSEGQDLIVPMPEAGVRTSVQVSQVTPTSQPQGQIPVRGMQSSVETQTCKVEDTNNIPDPISRIYPVYSNVPTARPQTPEGDLAELERMMSSSNYPSNRAVPLPRNHAQQIPILSAESVNSAIPISHNPHEGPSNTGQSRGTYISPGMSNAHGGSFSFGNPGNFGSGPGGDPGGY